MFPHSFQRAAAPAIRVAKSRPPIHQALLGHPRASRHFILVSETRTFSTSPRHNSNYGGQRQSFPSLVVQAVKQHPFSGGLVGLILVTLLGSMGYITYEQIKIKKAFMAYPESVREPLARAVFFHMWRDPERAFKCYREAVFKCQEAGLDPLSNLVIGLKGQIALFLAEHNNIPAAVEVFEMMRKEALEWLQENEDNPQVEIAERVRIVSKVDALAMQLADWYNDPSVNRPEDAEQMWISTVELMLKERQKIKEKGIVDIDFEDVEMASPLSRLGEHYAAKGMGDLALPLFLKSLEFLPTTSCPSVLIRANIASTLFTKQPLENPPPNWPSFQQQSKMWIKSAVDSYDRIPPGERDEACESGCWLAKTVLAVAAREEGDWDTANRLSQEISDHLSQHQNSLWAREALESHLHNVELAGKQQPGATDLIENKPGTTEK